MADTPRETALKALAALLAGIPGATVRRNEPLAAKIPAGGLITLFDGSGGEPEMLLSPPAYIHSRRAEIEVVVQGPTPEDCDGMLDGILAAIGDRLAVDPTLGGTVDLAMPEPPEFITEAIDGAAGLKGAKVIVSLEYTADSPLG